MKESTSILVAADVHALDGKSNLRSVLSLVASDRTAVQPSVVMLGGDLVGIGGSPQALTGEERARMWQPVFSLEEVRDEITRVFGKDVSAYFTYGSHDKNEIGAGRGFFTGPACPGGYYLYGISFCQMRFANDGQRAEAGYDGIDAADPYGGSAEQGAARFTAWAASLDDRKPILVLSHIPLHTHRADNRGAAIWCQALHQAGANHDIFVFFAHNHTTERHTDLDRMYYFVPAGKTIPVQGSGREDSREIRLNFTYLNAGYILKGCATLLTFSDTDHDGEYDTLCIRRYALDGAETAFGDTGFASPQLLQLKHNKRQQ